MDATSANVEVGNYLAGLTGDVKGLRIAVPKEYLGEGVGEEARESVLVALKVLEGMGATWEEVSLPHSKYALATYYLLSSSEASANLSRFDGVRYGVRSDNVNNLLDLYKTHVVKVSVMKLNVVLCLVHLRLALVTMMHITRKHNKYVH